MCEPHQTFVLIRLRFNSVKTDHCPSGELKCQEPTTLDEFIAAVLNLFSPISPLLLFPPHCFPPHTKSSFSHHFHGAGAYFTTRP